LKKISNPKLIRRNQQIGNYGQIGGMLILVGGFAASYFLPNQLELPYIALIAGFILVNIGASYNNHWGRVPPPDEAVDELLSTIPDEKGSPASHPRRRGRSQSSS